MIINPYVFGTVTGPIFDILSPGIGSGYSVRKLRTGQTNCLRVRRSSDNTEQDIGFSGDDLDTASLLSFVGSGSGYVVTWYDQSGNGVDCTMASSGSQPRIVNSGSLETENSKPTVVFDGSDDALASAYSSAAVYTNRTMTASVVERSQRTSSGNEAFFVTRPSGGRDYDTGFILERRTTNISAGLNTGAGAANYIGRHGSDSNTSALSHVAYFITPQTPAEAMYVDNVLLTLSNAYQAGSGAVSTTQNAGAGPHQIIIGNGNQSPSNASFDRPFQGRISEVLLWAVDLVGSRSTIYNSQKAYFGTP